MSFSKLVQQHFTVVLPHTERVQFAIPLRDNLLMLVFAQKEYCLYDFITNHEVFRAKLDQPVLQYHLPNEEEVLLLGEKCIQSIDIKSRQSTTYQTILQSSHSALWLFTTTRILVQVAEVPTRVMAVMAAHDLRRKQEPLQPVIFQLAPTTPLMVLLNQQNLLLTLNRAGSKVAYRHLMIDEDLAEIEVLQNGNLNIEADFNPVHAFLVEQFLCIIGTSKEHDCQLIHYSMEEQSIIRRVKLFDSKSYFLHSIIGEVRDARVLLKVNQLGRFIDLVGLDGQLTQSIRLEPRDSSLEMVVNATHSTIFSFENTNQRCFEKHKPDVPTLVKFVAYRAVSKQSLLAYLLHHININLGPNGMNKVLQCLV